MPEVLDPPFTDPNKAREAGLRSANLRQQQAKENEVLRLLLSQKPTEELSPPKPVNEEVNRQIDLANELVAHAHAQLKAITEDHYGFCPECKRHGADAKEQAALLRELRGLMEHLCRLHNIAQAPTSKVNPKASPTRTRATPEPTLATPSTPQVVSTPDITKPE